ncbi:MAG: TolC family protein, partial [Bdellovibrionia bacterium]
SDFDRLFKFQLKQAYREYLLLSEQIKYKKEFFSTYLELMKASKVRAEKGDISGVEYDRLDLERIGYEADYRSTELQLMEVSQKIRRLLGIPSVQSILLLKGEFRFIPLSELELSKRTVSMDQRADLKALLAKASQAEALASLKKRENIPGLMLGGEYRMKGPEGYFGFSVSMPLPIFNRNQGEIAKAEAAQQKHQIEADIKRQEISSEILTKYREVLIREQMLLKFQSLGLLEKNKSVAERSRFAYLKKAYSIVALLESQRNYMNVQKSYFDQLLSYYHAIDAFLAASEGS